jgi:hypothetical protein
VASIFSALMKRSTSVACMSLIFFHCKFLCFQWIVMKKNVSSSNYIFKSFVSVEIVMPPRLYIQSDSTQQRKACFFLRQIDLDQVWHRIFCRLFYHGFQEGACTNPYMERNKTRLFTMPIHAILFSPIHH